MSVQTLAWPGTSGPVLSRVQTLDLVTCDITLSLATHSETLGTASTPAGGQSEASRGCQRPETEAGLVTAAQM